MNNTKQFIDVFVEATDLFFFELEAVKVYRDIEEEISQNSSTEDFQNNRQLLYQKLEEKFDTTDDDFVRFVIGYSFKTGICFFGGLSPEGKCDIYKGKTGKRLKEFADTAVCSGLKLCNELLEKSSQYRLCEGMIERILESAVDKQAENQIENQIIAWVEKIQLEISEADSKKVKVGLEGRPINPKAVQPAEIGYDTELLIFKFEFLIHAIAYLLDSKTYSDKQGLLPRIEELIEFSKGQEDTAKATYAQYNVMGFACIFPSAFGLKIRYYQKAGDKEQERQTFKDLAVFYESLGDKRQKSGTSNDLLVAEKHFGDAVQILASKGFQAELSAAKIKLDKVRKQNIESKNGVILESYRDLRAGQENMKEQEFWKEFSSLDFQGKISYLAECTKTFTQKDVSEIRESNKKQNQFYEVFRTTIQGEHGQILFVDNREEERESYALFQSIQVYTSVIYPMLEEIVKEVAADGNATIVLNIIGLNPILEKRKSILNKAFELFFSGDIYNALYLLVPQVEYWFREEFYARGGQVSNLKFAPVEQSKTLGSIFGTEKLKDFLGENLHWLFEQLMTKEPMNLRNKIAHGLELGDNGYCLYFGLCVIKLMLNRTRKQEENK